MNRTLHRIINWLREADDNELTAVEESPANRWLSVRDEPWMRFDAEWQDWSFAEPGKQVLYLSYSVEIDGDLCGDPSLVFTIKDDSVEEISYSHCLGGVLDATNDPFAYEFLELVWDRHFAPRCEEEVTV